MRPWKVVALLLGVVLLGLIFFPVFAQPARYNGLLIDRNGNPIPDSEVVFINYLGEELSRGKTTATGHFHSPGTTDTPAKVRGFALTRIIRSTGGTDRCVYSPAQRISFKLVDSSGGIVPISSKLWLTKSRSDHQELNFVGQHELNEGPSAVRINRDVQVLLPDGWAQVRSVRQLENDSVEFTIQVRKKVLDGTHYTELNIGQIEQFMLKARAAPEGHIATFADPSDYRKFFKSTWGFDARFTGVYLRNPHAFAVLFEPYEQDEPSFPPLESFHRLVSSHGGEVVGVDALKPIVGPDGRTPIVYPSGGEGSSVEALISFSTESQARNAVQYIHSDYEVTVEKQGRRWLVEAKGPVSRGQEADEFTPFEDLAKDLGGKLEYVQAGHTDM